MGKSIIFDIQFGASGDMLLGSLIDLDLNTEILIEELSKLNIKNWSISPEKIVKYSIQGTLANVVCNEEKHSRNLDEIKKIIQKSKLKKSVRDNILIIFNRLAEAEARVHGVELDEVHFHEVGATDAIVDISAFCIAMDLLNINTIYFNNFHFGSGSIHTAHGDIPIPVPAVVELTKNYISIMTQRDGEIITPTAAAILTSLGKQIDDKLSYIHYKSGHGFGTRDYSFPSYTRAFLIKKEDHNENVIQIECNIDDMNPQIYPYIIEKLLETGALDAYISQISMKKGRPGILLTVITDSNLLVQMKETIYRHTTTLGLRTLKVNREKLDRDIITIKIWDHEIRIKIGCLNGEIVNIQPEFEDCKKVSKIKDIPLKEVMLKAKNEYINKKQKNI